ncbi:MAG: esterase-like activity of phytase family protein [Bacteroidaceae bacterium]|nr:esterase-like activity of phytase family protein [Bacteroidaceae bacterium]
MGIPPGNYSGITRLENNMYAVVSDKDSTDGFYVFYIYPNQTRDKILSVESYRINGGSRTVPSLDMEGICFVPNDISGTVFISNEADQRIREFGMDGKPTGRELRVPGMFGTDSIVRNRGFEALTYNHATRKFWTANESALKRDEASDPLKVHLQRFGDDLQPDEHYIYRLDPPRKARKASTKFYAHGVPALIAMDDGSIIVMERSLYSPRKIIGSYVEIKLYRVSREALEAAEKDMNLPVTKELVTSFRTHIRIGQVNYANYEGMCLGPKLSDGRQTILLINDSQNRQGNRLIRLKDYLKLIILP